MKPSRLIAAAAVLVLPALAAAQSAQPSLAKLLANDDAVITQAGIRELFKLQEYLFDKKGLSREERGKFKAIQNLTLLRDPKARLTPSQQQEAILSVASGVSTITAALKDPNELLGAAAVLVRQGTVREVNILEYWGDDPRARDRLKLVGGAIMELLQRGGQAAIEAQKVVEAKIDKASSQKEIEQLQAQLEKLEMLIGLSKYNRAMFAYTYALGLDSSDPKRKEVADEALKQLTDMLAGGELNPEAELLIMAQVPRLAMVKGDWAAAIEGFGKVIANPKSSWGDRYNAHYFGVVTQVLAKQVDAALKGYDTHAGWLKLNPPAEDMKKGVEAADRMLRYRIAALEASTLKGADKLKADKRAQELLQSLLRDRPDLKQVILEQLVLLEDPNKKIADVDVLLLNARVGAAERELGKDKPDQAAIEKGIQAAQEVLARVKKGSVKPEDAEGPALLIGFLFEKLGDDANAAEAYLAYVAQYRNDRNKMNLAFNNASAALARLQKAQPPDARTPGLYLRVLRMGVEPPFSRADLRYDFGRSLLESTVHQAGIVQSNNKKAGQAILDDIERAIRELKTVPDSDPRLSRAKFYIVVALKTSLDLDARFTKTILSESTRKDRVGQIVSMADDLNALFESQLKTAPSETAGLIRSMHVRTALLASDIAFREKKDAAKAIALLEDIEESIKGMGAATEASILGEALLIRVNALMSLKKTQEAVDNVVVLLKNRSGDEGASIVFMLLKSLNEEMDEEASSAEPDRERIRELARNRSVLSSYMVEWSSKHSEPRIKAAAPKYLEFDASSKYLLATLEVGEARAKALDVALEAYRALDQKSPATRLGIALISYERGDFAMSQSLLAELLRSKEIGAARLNVRDKLTGVTRTVDNAQYWEAMYKLMMSNVALVKKPPRADFNAENLRKETIEGLKGAYIQWGRPGGEKWGEAFDKLRQELIPDWTPPALAVPTTSASTSPTTQP